MTDSLPSERADMAGDRYDLGALYLRHRDAMHRVAASVLRESGRASEAEDAVSEAIGSILSKPPKGVANWEAFLVIAAKRKALDRLRSAEVRRTNKLVAVDEHEIGDGVDVAEDVVEALDRQRLGNLAKSSLPSLTENESKVVWEIAGLGRSRQEVAQDLGVSPSRVSQLLGQGLRKLKTEMDRKEGGNG